MTPAETTHDLWLLAVIILGIIGFAIWLELTVSAEERRAARDDEP